MSGLMHRSKQHAYWIDVTSPIRIGQIARIIGGAGSLYKKVAPYDHLV
jgi:hypothetical protein